MMEQEILEEESPSAINEKNLMNNGGFSNKV
jgi:hypothetical protein